MFSFPSSIYFCLTYVYLISPSSFFFLSLSLSRLSNVSLVSFFPGSSYSSFLFVVFPSSNENKKRSSSLRIPAETEKKQSQKKIEKFFEKLSPKKKDKRPFFVNTYKNLSVISFCARAFFLPSSSVSCLSRPLF
jgi:hypothetical protein